jgi:branched chain amino acid efflux pump
MKASSKSSNLRALQSAIPIWAGYIAIGIPFGALARQTGLSPIEIALMSVIVFAGSSQFIAVSMFASGASILPIIITTFFINLRHLLMSSSLALHVKGSSKPLLSLFAYGVTDETFAVNLTRFSEGHWDMRRSLIVNHTSNIVWITSTIVGSYLGDLIPRGALGIDYALTAMFIGLLVYQLKGSLILLVSIISGLLAVIFCMLLPGAWFVVLSSVIAATIGVALTRSNAAGSKEGRKSDVP